MTHTASDFSLDAAYELGSIHAKRAAEAALYGQYGRAIDEYRAAAKEFGHSTARTAPERIAFCESEKARLEGLLTKGGAR